MHNQKQKDLAKYRLEKAKEMLAEADVLFDGKFCGFENGIRIANSKCKEIL